MLPISLFLIVSSCPVQKICECWLSIGQWQVFRCVLRASNATMKSSVLKKCHSLATPAQMHIIRSKRATFQQVCQYYKCMMFKTFMSIVACSWCDQLQPLSWNSSDSLLI